MSRFKAKAKGAMTLLVTSALVIAALITTLGSYKVLFYQIKRTQNEIKARQAHWHAEAGIECAYAYLHTYPELLSAPSLTASNAFNELCLTPFGLEWISIESLGSERYVIQVKGRHSQIVRYSSYQQIVGTQTAAKSGHQLNETPVSNPASVRRSLVWHPGGWYAQ